MTDPDLLAKRLAGIDTCVRELRELARLDDLLEFATADRRRAVAVRLHLWREPHASSPTANGWQSTPPWSSGAASRRRSRRKWSIQTDVSTRVVTGSAAAGAW